MINLIQRSNQRELMDADDISFADMAHTLKELDIINRFLGGHSVTLGGVQKLIGGRRSVTICEIGCGGGDNLYAIDRFCKKKNIAVDFVGIDMNPQCIAFAQKHYSRLKCRWICSDYANVDLSAGRPDIIFSSLFCHHLDNRQLGEMLMWLKQNCTTGFFINDLHRHWLPYYLIKYITRFFSRSYLVKNDACISVAKGFKRNEWKRMLIQESIIEYEIRWKWAFRYLVTCKNASYAL